ncbi:MAG: DUF3999 domain-containing protein [bacterium]|nr:DUF3999 domain-containing protein [bacterium]
MKKIIFILIFFLAGICGIFAGALNKNSFQYAANLKGPVKKDSIYQVSLSANILEKCRPECRDARVLDSEGKEIPYVIINNHFPASKAERYTLTITDYSNNNNSAVMHMQLPARHEPVNKINVDTEESDFKKNYRLFGSSNKKNWKLLTRGSLYDFTSQVDVRKTTIRFKRSPWRYYRLNLADSGSGKSSGRVRLKYKDLEFSSREIQNKKIRINEITAFTTYKKGNTTIYDTKTFDSFSTEIDDNKNTVITLKAGLPFETVSFKVGNSYYYRTIKVYGSATGKENSFRFLTGGSLYRFSLFKNKESNNSLSYDTVKHAYYRFVIENNDNPPLEIKSIQLRWVQKKLYFVALANSENYSLHFGSSSLERPEYDLAAFITQNNWFSHNRVKIRAGAIISNKDYKPGEAPESEESNEKLEKTILTVVVILLVLGMGVWLAALLRKR